MPSTFDATFASSKKSSKKSPIRKKSSASGWSRFTPKYCWSIGEARASGEEGSLLESTRGRGSTRSARGWEAAPRRSVRSAPRMGLFDRSSAARPRGPFRLLAFDLDGTFLEPDGRLGAPAARFLARLRSGGVELVAATGRRLFSALPVLERLEL